MSEPYDYTTTSDAPVAVIGAGLAGLSCAKVLASQGRAVAVFEKARGPSGRCATRESRSEQTGQYDHGAQYYTVRSPSFRAQHEHWLAHGVSALWSARIGVWDPSQPQLATKSDEHERYIGTPGMSALGRQLADEVRALFARMLGRPRPAAIDVTVLTPIPMVVFVILASLTLLLLVADVINPVVLNL